MIGPRPSRRQQNRIASLHFAAQNGTALGKWAQRKRTVHNGGRTNGLFVAKYEGTGPGHERTGPGHERTGPGQPPPPPPRQSNTPKSRDPNFDGNNAHCRCDTGSRRGARRQQSTVRWWTIIRRRSAFSRADGTGSCVGVRVGGPCDGVRACAEGYARVSGGGGGPRAGGPRSGSKAADRFSTATPEIGGLLGGGGGLRFVGARGTWGCGRGIGRKGRRWPREVEGHGVQGLTASEGTGLVPHAPPSGGRGCKRANRRRLCQGQECKDPPMEGGGGDGRDRCHNGAPCLRRRKSTPPPCESNTKVPKFDGNTSSCCFDKGVALARGGGG